MYIVHCTTGSHCSLSVWHYTVCAQFPILCCFGCYVEETHSCRWQGLVDPVSNMLVTLFRLLVRLKSQA